MSTKVWIYCEDSRIADEFEIWVTVRELAMSNIDIVKVTPTTYPDNEPLIILTKQEKNGWWSDKRITISSTPVLYIVYGEGMESRIVKQAPFWYPGQTTLLQARKSVNNFFGDVYDITPYYETIKAFFTSSGLFVKNPPPQIINVPSSSSSSSSSSTTTQIINTPSTSRSSTPVPEIDPLNQIIALIPQMDNDQLLAASRLIIEQLKKNIPDE